MNKDRSGSGGEVCGLELVLHIPTKYLGFPSPHHDGGIIKNILKLMVNKFWNSLSIGTCSDNDTRS